MAINPPTVSYDVITDQFTKWEEFDELSEEKIHFPWQEQCVYSDSEFIEELYRKQTLEYIESAIWTLDWRSRRVIHMRFYPYSEYSFDEIRYGLHLSKKRVQEIASQALQQVREILFEVENYDSHAEVNNKAIEMHEDNYVSIHRIKAVIGDPNSQFYLGILFETGQQGFQIDSVASNWWYRKAAMQGHAKAQYILGVHFSSDHYRDKTYALFWFRKAAEQGHIFAMYALGEYFERHPDLPHNMEEAVKWYKMAAEKNEPRAQCRLGLCLEKGLGIQKDEYEGVYWYLKSAESENRLAQYHLGLCYENGIGVKRDMSEAVKWYTSASQFSMYHRQHRKNISYCYDNKIGYSVDANEINVLDQWPDPDGNADAQYHLGLCYANGYGINQNLSCAITWIRRSAHHGNSDAQNNLGDAYYYGNGVRQDYRDAVYWYQKSACQGNDSAQYHLGNAYYYGYGVSQDYSKAIACYQKAAERGNENAKLRLVEIEHNLNMPNES